jgi:prepilin-type N-terminal cleavage/methylation domain-containing protein
MQGIIRNKRAFTLIEVIMVIVLVGVFSYGVSLYVLRVIDSWKFLTQRYELEQDSKLALDIMVRDIREIGLDASSNPTISYAGDDTITFANTVLDNITYSYSSGVIYKNSRPLAKNISSLQVRYYDKANNELSSLLGGLSAAQIADIWYLYLRFEASKGDQNAFYSSYVFPRNFLAR